ncbi:hypothetical protein BDV23DRAFT_32945 [Aspergillus alliaceus]|uniref:Uncharacterized protein n=1 Tax=Petromyces alliaceus TaxID=209559 RepID=A0A5N7CHT3_PETAA|nr:hypothetical protein BDV23DRAFT_32945 [Aspergillus alliaceus]
MGAERTRFSAALYTLSLASGPRIEERARYTHVKMLCITASITYPAIYGAELHRKVSSTHQVSQAPFRIRPTWDTIRRQITNNHPKMEPDAENYAP